MKKRKLWVVFIFPSIALLFGIGASILTMGALSAINACPEFRDYYDRKMKEDKKHLQALNAIKNKMLLRVAAVINQQKNYENKYQTACA